MSVFYLLCWGGTECDGRCRESLAIGYALAEGAKHLSKVFVVAVVFDAILQFLAYGSVRPGWAVTVGILLAAVPYVLSRGLTNRVMRLRGKRGDASAE